MDSLSHQITLPAELLVLSDIQIEEVKLTPSNEIIIRVTSTKKETLCHCCGKPTAPYGKGMPLRMRHLPILGKKTFIEITPLRGICSSCDDNPTTTQTLSWHDR